MKHVVAAALMLILSVLPGLAQDTRSGEVTQTIQKQLDAFQEDDFSAAFTYAKLTVCSPCRLQTSRPRPASFHSHHFNRALSLS